MIKKEKVSKDNIVKFPSKLTDLEREIEAVTFEGNLTILSFDTFSFLIINFSYINFIK
jgi:hypothetical protein